jgi:hypothetical protein
LLPLGPIFSKPGTLAPTEVWPGGIVTANEEPPPPEEPHEPEEPPSEEPHEPEESPPEEPHEPEEPQEPEDPFSPAETAQLAAKQAAANAQASNRAAERAEANFDDVKRLAPSSGQTRQQQDAAIARAEAGATKAQRNAETCTFTAELTQNFANLATAAEARGDDAEARMYSNEAVEQAVSSQTFLEEANAGEAETQAALRSLFDVPGPLFG